MTFLNQITFFLMGPLFSLQMGRGEIVMQSYPARALGRRFQVDWARYPRVGPRVLISLRVDFEPMD